MQNAIQTDAFIFLPDFVLNPLTCDTLANDYAEQCAERAGVTFSALTPALENDFKEMTLRVEDNDLSTVSQLSCRNKPVLFVEILDSLGTSLTREFKLPKPRFSVTAHGFLQVILLGHSARWSQLKNGGQVSSETYAFVTWGDKVVPMTARTKEKSVELFRTRRGGSPLLPFSQLLLRGA